MSRESRTISVLEGDWDRWGDLAWKARVSRSEFVRRAVEAYTHGCESGDVEEVPGREGAPIHKRVVRDNQQGTPRIRDVPRVVRRRGGFGVDGRVAVDADGSTADSIPIDTTPPGWERCEVSAAPGHGPQARPTPFPKEAQTRRRKK